MSTQTEHLKLDLREAADIFNPLSTNANFESLDSIIYEIQTKGGVPTYTTTASANLLKLSQNPTPNVTVFKFVAAGDANTWSYQETVNNIVALDGTQKTVKAGEMYVAWVNSANAMVVIAWPDVVNAQTFDGKAPAEWATKAQLDAVNRTAANATQTAQAAAMVANNALEIANKGDGPIISRKFTAVAPSKLAITPSIIVTKTQFCMQGVLKFASSSWNSGRRHTINGNIIVDLSEIDGNILNLNGVDPDNTATLNGVIFWYQTGNFSSYAYSRGSLYIYYNKITRKTVMCALSEGTSFSSSLPNAVFPFSQPIYEQPIL